MKLLDQKLGDAREAGKGYATVTLMSTHAPVDEVVEYAQSLNWRVQAVWQSTDWSFDRGPLSVTNILFRYRAP